MTNWRTYGPVSAETWRIAIDQAGGPEELSSRAAWEAAGEHSALCLAMLRAESSYGTHFNRNIPGNKNPLNLRPPTGGGYMAYGSWVEGVKAWHDRITSPTYKGGIYARTVTLLDLINVYAPASDDNRPEEYVGIIETLFVRWGVLPRPGETGMVTFGNVPHPPFQDRPIPNNTAWNDLGPRTIRAVCWHRMIGTLWGTDSWFRGGGSARALTDYGIGVAAQDGAGNAGAIVRWNDPRGRRAPWANGQVSAPYGDGLAFVNRYGVNAVNRDVVSIEISGATYTVPLDEAARDAIALLTAYWADQYRVSHETFPLIPGEGNRSFVIWHQEFTIGTGKVCPGQVVMDETPSLIDRTRAILRQYQTGEVVVPQPPATTTPAPMPEPEPDPWALPVGMSPELARRYYGEYVAPWGETYRYATTTGPVGQATAEWIKRGSASIPAGGEWWQGKWPELSEVTRRQKDETKGLAFRWLDGSSWQWEADAA